MATYKINLFFTDNQLESFFQTDARVVISKPLVRGDMNVAWQVFKPWQVNTIIWSEQYGLYATTSDASLGDHLLKLSSTAIGAVQNRLYVLQPSGVLVGTTSSEFSNSFAILNHYIETPFMVLGLFQDAIVNQSVISGNSISATPVLLKQMLVVEPCNNVFIWVQTGLYSNSLVSVVPSPVTALIFGGENKEISAVYDSASGLFFEE